MGLPSGDRRVPGLLSRKMGSGTAALPGSGPLVGPGPRLGVRVQPTSILLVGVLRELERVIPLRLSRALLSLALTSIICD